MEVFSCVFQIQYFFLMVHIINHNIFKIFFYRKLSFFNRSYKYGGENFAKIAKEYDFKMKTCVEGTLLDQFGFDSSGCMIKNVLENAIGFNLKVPKGKYIIRDCDCLFGRDIGAYNTCLHGCKYCYANSNIKLVKKNQKLHNPTSPILIGEVSDGDVVKEISEPSFIDTQSRLF